MIAACLALGCASAPPLRPAPLPTDQQVRRESLDSLARSLFDAMQAGSPERVLADLADLDALLAPGPRLRVERERANRHAALPREGLREALAQASYAGFCAQGAREEPAGRGSLQLSSEAWVLDRLLVVAQIGLRPSAAWVEGNFVFTDRGWKALSLSRVEQPRVQHADLELAPCDVELGIR